MKTQELRIGNLLQSKVQLNFTDLKIPKYAMVDIVMLMDLQRLGADKWAFEPIPLTEEWLKQFGFFNNGTTYSFPKSKFLLYRGRDAYYLKVGDWLDTKFGNCEIQFLHQLQNLYFALTGEELTTSQ